MTAKPDAAFRLRSWIIPLAALALCAGVLLGRAITAPLPAAVALLAALAACFLLRKAMRSVAILALTLCIGCLGGWHAYHPSLPPEGEYVVSGVIAQEVQRREDHQVRTILRDVTLNGQPLRSGAYWTYYADEEETEPAFSPGDRVQFTGRVYHPRGAQNPGGFDFREYLLQHRMTLGVYGSDDLTLAGDAFSLSGCLAKIRHELSQRLVRAMGEEAGRYASAMLLGLKSLIPDEDLDAFSRLGIAHILSVSGYHTGVLAFLLDALLKRFNASRKLRTLLTVPVLLGYCLLTGANPPVIRAAILVILYQTGQLQQRQNCAPHLLSCAVILTLLLQPTQLTSPSFQLSYGAMLGLVLVEPWLTYHSPLSRLGTSRPAQMLRASIAAQVGLLLPQLYWFHELPLFSVAINLIVLGGASFLLGGYWLVLLLLPLPPAAAAAGRILQWITEPLLLLIRHAGSLDGLLLWTPQANLATALGWLLMLLGISILWPRRRALTTLTGTVILLISLIPLPHAGVHYTQLSVGDADAALLHDHDVLIAVDAGEESDLASYLHRRRLRLDGLILTHLHQDHTGGVRALLDQQIPVRTVYLPVDAALSDIDPESLALVEELIAAGARVQTIAAGDVIPLPSGEIRVLWPHRDGVRPGQDANHYSAALHVTLLDTTLLLAGDLTGAYERYAAVPADILKAAHHGSAGSTSAEFLSAVAPQALLLSTGDEEREADFAARCPGIPLYSTHSGGAITLEINENGVIVRPMHERSE